jgi:hypothetical protein
LKRKGRKESAAEMEAVTNRVKNAGRDAEDKEEPVQTAAALRDGTEADMNETARDFRMKLGSRSLTATKELPYKAIFNKGIGYYVDAVIPDKEKRMKELLSRVETGLLADDSLKAPLISTLTSNVDAFVTASSALFDARTVYSIARTALEKAVDEWDIAVEKTYGVLITAFGKKAAEGFFPKAKRLSAAQEETKAAPTE